MFISSYKWSLREISFVKIKSDQFLIGIQEKDQERHFEINKTDLSIKTFWKGGRPRVLNLQILDKTTKIFKVYSVTNNEHIKLEEITHKLKKNANY